MTTGRQEGATAEKAVPSPLLAFGSDSRPAPAHPRGAFKRCAAGHPIID